MAFTTYLPRPDSTGPLGSLRAMTPHVSSDHGVCVVQSLVPGNPYMSGTAAQRESFRVEPSDTAIPSGAANIQVRLNAQLSYADGTGINATLFFYSGSRIDDASAQSVPHFGDSFPGRDDGIIEWTAGFIATNPFTSLPWTKADIDALEIGITINSFSGADARLHNIALDVTYDAPPDGDPPVLTLSKEIENFPIAGAAQVIDSALTLTNDTATITGAVVAFTKRYRVDEHVLAFVDQLGITGFWNPITGVLTLSGSAATADYQTALRSVTFRDTNTTARVGRVTVRFTATDGAGSSSDSLIVWVLPAGENPDDGDLLMIGPEGLITPRREPMLTVSDVVNDGVNSFSATVIDEPQVGWEIELITFPDTLLFGGTIQQVKERFEEITTQLVWDVSMVDYAFQLDRIRPFGQWVDVSATTVLQEIFDNYAEGFTYDNLTLALPNVTVVLDGTDTFSAAITKILKQIAGSWFLDYDGDLNAFLDEQELTDNPDPLNDSNMTLLKNPPLVSTVDVSQLRTRTYVKGASATAMEATPAGQDKILIDDISMFSGTGGEAISKGQIFSYTGTLLQYDTAVVTPGAPVATADNTVTGNIKTNQVRYKVQNILPAGAGPVSAPSNQPFVSPADQMGIGGVVVTNNFGTGNVNLGSYTYAIRNHTADGEAGAISVSFSMNQTTPGKGVKIEATVQSGDARTDAISLFRIIGGNYYRIGQFDITLPGTQNANYAFVIDDQSDADIIAASIDIDGLIPGLGYTPTTWPNVLVGSQVNVTVPLGPGGTTSRKLFRAVGTAGYTLLTTIADNVTTLYVDNTDTDTPGGDEAPGAATVFVSGYLTGIPAGGNRSLQYDVIGGDPVNLWVQRDDLAAQAAYALLSGDDGVREYVLNAQYANSITKCNALGDADLTLFSTPRVEVTYATRDKKTRSGKTISVTLTNPPLTLSLKILDVKINRIHEDLVNGVYQDPVYTVTASSTKFTFEDLLRKVKLDDATDGGSGGGSFSGGTASGGATAASLSPGRTINGVLFDGSADILVPTRIVVGEVPTGSVNGSNTAFDTAHVYILGSTRVYLNGLRMKRTVDYAETDNNTITFTTAPSTGDLILVDYERP